MPRGPDKGDHTPLLHTLKSRQRVVVGLRWDPREDQAKFMDRFRGTHHQHDLDIVCFVYDHNKDYVDFVGSAMDESMDQSGAIYHSGDDQTGEGGGDDEFITVELAALPDDVSHLVFLVEIRTKHTFADVDSPAARIVDSMTNATLIDVDIACAESRDKMAWVFAHLYRDASSPTGWMLHHVGEFPDIAQITDWGAYLKRYLI